MCNKYWQSAEQSDSFSAAPLTLTHDFELALFEEKAAQPFTLHQPPKVIQPNTGTKPQTESGSFAFVFSSV